MKGKPLCCLQGPHAQREKPGGERVWREVKKKGLIEGAFGGEGTGIT